MRPIGLNQFKTGDPAAASVTLLVHADGPDAGVNNVFLDRSSQALTVVPNGSPLQGLPSPYAVPGAGSVVCVPETLWLRMANPAQLAFGTGDFNCEMWLYPTSSNQGVIIDWRADHTNTEMLLSTNGSNQIGVAANGAYITSLATLTLNQWQHIAWSRQAGSLRFFHNGVQVGATIPSSHNLSVGTSRPTIATNGFTAGETGWAGRISDIRILKGSALYTANFTPPTSPLTDVTNTVFRLPFDNAKIADVARKSWIGLSGTARLSTAQSKFGGSSIYFDGGTGWAYVQPQSNADMAMGTGDFTIEFWARHSGGDCAVIDFRPGINGFYPCISFIGGTVAYTVNDATRLSGGEVPANTWCHIAVCRVSGQTRLFLNGVMISAGFPDASNYVAPNINRPTIGCSGYAPGTALFVGYLDEIRFTKGVGRYPANFTPPTAPFPNP